MAAVYADTRTPSTTMSPLSVMGAYRPESRTTPTDVTTTCIHQHATPRGTPPHIRAVVDAEDVAGAGGLGGGKLAVEVHVMVSSDAQHVPGIAADLHKRIVHLHQAVREHKHLLHITSHHIIHGNARTSE